MKNYHDYLGAERISREEWYNLQDLKHAKEMNKMFLKGYAIPEFIDENGKLFVFEEIGLFAMEIEIK